MLTSALSALLPQTRDRSDANLGKHTASLKRVSLGLLDFQSSQHCIAAKVKNCPGVRFEIQYIYICTVSKYGNAFRSITLLATVILQSLPEIRAAHYSQYRQGQLWTRLL